MSVQILDLSKHDQTMSVRVADVHDLIASEGKYHLICFSRFTRDSTHNKDKSIDTNTDIAMIWLLNELKKSADHGDILELTEVWYRYCNIANESDITITPSFTSRLATFKEKLTVLSQGLFDVIVLRDRAATENRTVLVPTKFAHIPISAIATSEDQEDEMTIPVYRPEDNDDFLSLVHVALKLRGDILKHKKFSGLEISEQNAINFVPDSVHMFLSLLLGGQELLAFADADDTTKHDCSKYEALRQSRILSIGQDMVYSVSGGKQLTPKHIGLASTLHQATRSKHLVQLFHNAGHVVHYRDVLRLDTALAESTLKTMDASGAIIPPNLVAERFVHFSVDNIDINDSTLDGMNTFHATQAAAWQRGPAPCNILDGIDLSKNTTLNVPEELNCIIPPKIEGVVQPIFNDDVKPEWFQTTIQSHPESQKASVLDLTFMIKRQDETQKASWTGHNQSHSLNNAEQTTIGYLPIIQAPAHDIETLNTVIQRLLHIVKSTEQRHVVVTVDEALYPHLMHLKWGVPEYRDILIPRLGGLHTAMVFHRILGQHMEDSGLIDMWVDSGIIGAKAAERVMAGKGYSRNMRMHKLTLQALWHILLPKLYTYLEAHNEELKCHLENMSKSENKSDRDDLVMTLLSAEFRECMDAFLLELQDDNPCALFWWQYMEMVGILLQFTRADREGLWQLHLDSFTRMLAYFFHYNHTNYARWGTVYIAEMHLLPPEVLLEFCQGNFVVKETNKTFNQVSADHSLEWLNGIGKKGGGIIGITKTSSALSRWALSYNLRAQISKQTREMLLSDYKDDDYVPTESTSAREKRDTVDERKLVAVLTRHCVFENVSSVLQNIVTKDLATDEISSSLLNAEKLGQVTLNKFVQERLAPLRELGKRVELSDRLQKTSVSTFASLYAVQKVIKDKQLTIKVDRNILQRLITAYDAGRTVKLESILNHELMPVPISLATTNGCLNTGNKSLLAEILIGDTCPSADVTLSDSTCVIIDGQALVMTLGKPNDVDTFGGLAEKFANCVYEIGRKFERIDVTFDRYVEQSIKGGTREKRTKGYRPVRRVIENSSVPLPGNWSNFIGLGDNKADLANFLSQYLLEHSPAGKSVVVSGGFSEICTAKSSDGELDTTLLEATHEEADTRIILHCLHTDANEIVVWSRDTDVLVLLLAHFPSMRCNKLWLKTETAKKWKYIPIHEIIHNLHRTQVETLLGFHAVTGCDTVSYITGHSKKTAWKVFQSDHNLLHQLGIGDLTDETIKSVDKFLYLLYKVPTVTTCDQARVTLFRKCRTHESLPPTSDAAELHIRRAHYQTMIWRQANIPKPQLPNVTDFGWTLIDGKIKPKLMSKPPIPQACAEIISCGCNKGCATLRCSCRRLNLTCTAVCHCKNVENVCKNS